MTRTKTLLPLAGLLALASAALASIERLDLRGMLERADNAVFGEIVGKRVSAVPVFDGAEELYFTTLTVKGASILNGEEITVEVSYPGGFVSPDRGVYDSEAPRADDVKVGRRVVVFYKWSDNMGGGFASNALYASHGGIFRTFVSAKGRVVVQGRGTGYAVSQNRTLDDLEANARKLRPRRR